MRPLVLAANGSPANDSRGSRFWGYRFRGYRFSGYKFAANWSDYLKKGLEGLKMTKKSKNMSHI